MDAEILSSLGVLAALAGSTAGLTWLNYRLLRWGIRAFGALRHAGHERLAGRGPLRLDPVAR